MRPLAHPDLADVPLSSVLQALSDPTRLRIVRIAAACNEQACGAFDLPLPKATLSHHWKVLRLAGLIRIRAEGTRHFNSLRRKELDARFPGLLKSVLAAAEPL